MVFWKCKKTINLLKMSRLDQGAEKWRLNGRRKDAQIFPDRWSSPSQSGSHQNIHFFKLRLLSWKSCTNLLRSVIIAAVLSRKIWRCSVWSFSWKNLQNFQLDIYPARHAMIVANVADLSRKIRLKSPGGKTLVLTSLHFCIFSNFCWNWNWKARRLQSEVSNIT